MRTVPWRSRNGNRSIPVYASRSSRVVESSRRKGEKKRCEENRIDRLGVRGCMTRAGPPRRDQRRAGTCCVGEEDQTSDICNVGVCNTNGINKQLGLKPGMECRSKGVAIKGRNQLQVLVPHPSRRAAITRPMTAPMIKSPMTDMQRFSMRHHLAFW